MSRRVPYLRLLPIVAAFYFVRHPRYFFYLAAGVKKNGKDQIVTLTTPLQQQAYQDSQKAYARIAESYFYLKKDSEMRAVLKSALQQHPENEILRKLWNISRTPSETWDRQQIFIPDDRGKLHFYWELRMLERQRQWNS